jgi:hypothetical protein
VPKACSSQGGTETDTVSDFGGNGLIGMAFQQHAAHRNHGHRQQ